MTTYHVRVWCADESVYYRWTQTTLDPTEVPTGCDVSHTRDFVREWQEEDE